MSTPVITVTTSAAHLKIAVCDFRKVTSREERIAIAEKHKPYMLEKDIDEMRERFKNLPYQST